MKTKCSNESVGSTSRASVPGVVVYLIAAVFCLTIFRAVERHSHSVSDTLYGVFPFFVSSFLLLDWVAGKSSG